MRIRRRPPGQPIVIVYLLPSDPYPAPQSSPPPASRDHPPPPPGDKQQGEGKLHLHPATNDSAADLGAARSSSPLSRPALPPQDAAVEQRSKGLLGAQQQQLQLQQAPAHGRSSSLENGLHRHVPEPVTNQAGELLINNKGVGAAAVVTTAATKGAKVTKHKQLVTKNTSGGVKRAPPSPSKEVAGSQCSRKNGRGWRCSQPTPKGYALCEYHLGKGRMKDRSSTIGRRGPGQLGRTEHANKKTSPAAPAAATGGRGPGQLGRTKHAEKTSAAAVAPATAAAPKEDMPPPPPPNVAPATAPPKADVPPPSVQHA